MTVMSNALARALPAEPVVHPNGEIYGWRGAFEVDNDPHLSIRSVPFFDKEQADDWSRRCVRGFNDRLDDA